MKLFESTWFGARLSCKVYAPWVFRKNFTWQKLSVNSWFWWSFNISPHHRFFGMLVEGNAQEHSLYFFSGGGAYVRYRCMEKSPAVPTKSMWLSRLAIQSPTDLLKSKHIHVPRRCLVTSLNYLSTLSFVKTVKTITCCFNGMTWLLSLLTCKAFAVQSEIMSGRSNKYQSDKVFGEAFYVEWTNTTSRI